jgi:hypothetical protein
MAHYFLALPEVAERLKVKPLWLTRWLRKNPVDSYGVPLYRLAGRDKRFDEESIARIFAALPAPEAACRSSSSHPAQGARRTGRSGARTSA